MFQIFKSGFSRKVLVLLKSENKSPLRTLQEKKALENNENWIY
jgi:hypothetical protein